MAGKASSMIRRSVAPKRSSKIRKKRRGPPRNGRVKDPDFMEFVAGDGECIVFEHGWILSCGGGPTLHHVKAGPGAQKDDRRVVRLCQAHHLHDFGLLSIERLGKAGFERKWEIDLEAEIRKNNERYENRKV